MPMKKKYNIILLLLMFGGCASQPLLFRDKEPVYFFNDINPIKTPKSVHRDVFNYYANVKPQRPVVRAFHLTRDKGATDINSYDVVPASSWYLPRLGYYDINPEEMIYGMTEAGPPKPPITIIKVRRPEYNPRFFIKDSKGIYYLLKFDDPDFPYLATSTSFIVNRLFWGFGYNVPEDHLFWFKRDQIEIGPESGLTEQEVDIILTRVASPVNGYFRTISSRIIKGLPLGQGLEKGVREDDPNDLFPHEERRTLRALKMFCSFINMNNISTDNLFDIYVGPEDKGYIKHYMIDFDDAFGTKAMKDEQYWGGFNHLFSVDDILKNFITAGLIVNDWEKIKLTPWKSVGIFESAYFEPENWKETYPFEPIRNSQPADDYWAAKILGALTNEHITTLVEAAQYPQEDAKSYMIRTLIARRDKILKYCLSNVVPVEFDRFEDGTLILKDYHYVLLHNVEPDYSYRVEFYDSNDKIIQRQDLKRSKNGILNINFPERAISNSNDYVIVRIFLLKNDKLSSFATEFHVKRSGANKLKMIGIVH